MMLKKDGFYIIINILKPTGITPETYIDNIDENVAIIPYLYDIEKKQFNNEALLYITQIINNLKEENYYESY